MHRASNGKPPGACGRRRCHSPSCTVVARRLTHPDTERWWRL